MGEKRSRVQRLEEATSVWLGKHDTQSVSSTHHERHWHHDKCMPHAKHTLVVWLFALHINIPVTLSATHAARQHVVGQAQVSIGQGPLHTFHGQLCSILDQADDLCLAYTRRCNRSGSIMNSNARPKHCTVAFQHHPQVPSQHGSSSDVYCPGHCASTQVRPRPT